jgi:hypothetical protein
MSKLEYQFQQKSIEYLKLHFSEITDFSEANETMSMISGIRDFFPKQTDYSSFSELLKTQRLSIRDEERREYGDYQTPDRLTDEVCMFIKGDIQPKVLIEPTFGKGSFILSALKNLLSLKYIFGVEIHEQYVWHSKFRILEYFVENPDSNKPSIFLFNADVFDFDWKVIRDTSQESLLVLGNPPWVTNAELSSLGSSNIPRKSNFKRHKGLDAITGKGNFDIGEFVVLTMLNEFSGVPGSMAMLLKNSVVKNLVYDLRKTNYKISDLRSFSFDAKEHFTASVEASLFTCKFNHVQSDFVCSEYDLSKPSVVEKSFGWIKDKFVSNLILYQTSAKYDGECPFEWRQGVKHDNSKIFEMTKIGDKLYNGFDEEVCVEEERIFGIVKSSDLKGHIISKPRKYVLITQTYLGEDTLSLAEKFPMLFTYLNSKQEFLKNRKSAIYANKPDFSIFGIGGYSFKPFKVAISGLYKSPSFTLILPENNKPLMLDDTCYFLGFDQLSDAVFAWLLLKDRQTLDLLKCIIFEDAKRPYTKEILMRIALDEIASDIGFDVIASQLEELQQQFDDTFDYEDWESFLEKMKRHQEQLALF